MGYKVQGSGFRVQGSGFRVQGLGIDSDYCSEFVGVFFQVVSVDAGMVDAVDPYAARGMDY